MDAKDIITKYVCPSLGTIMATAVFAAPIKSLRQALARGSLQDLNPTPWAFMTGNCLGWVAYSYVTQNIFVLASNLPGLILSVWLNIGAAKLQYLERYEILRTTAIHDASSHLSFSLRLELNDDSNDREGNSNDSIDDGAPAAIATAKGDNNNERGELSNINASNTSGTFVTSTNNEMTMSQVPLPASTRHEYWLIQIVLVWSIVLSFVMFVTMSNERKAQIIGVVVNLNLVIFYGAPLSTILQVLQTKSSHSIHRRTLATSLFNTTFWLVYALAIFDMVIFVPNVCGFVLNIVTLFLCIIFSDKSMDEEQGGISEPLLDNTV